MENAVLKKRLNTFNSGEKGTLSSVSNEVVIDVLRAVESWPGSAADLYRDLGLSKMQLVTMIQKAKRLVKSGVFPESGFKEIKVEGSWAVFSGNLCGIELCWDSGKVIRFAQVEQLVDFLKKVA
jgi:hypothetical protein